ncbi:hypothetical protein HMPREF1248_1410 [Coriobacteriaceae bacterium BV3Ac1]|nr:hypothetical protein HMPREF1248_1410 [Coriobacteriaceae bacterium BV3Ac1]
MLYDSLVHLCLYCMCVAFTYIPVFCHVVLLSAAPPCIAAYAAERALEDSRNTKPQVDLDVCSKARYICTCAESRQAKFFKLWKLQEKAAYLLIYPVLP